MKSKISKKLIELDLFVDCNLLEMFCNILEILFYIKLTYAKVTDKDLISFISHVMKNTIKCENDFDNQWLDFLLNSYIFKKI